MHRKIAVLLAAMSAAALLSACFGGGSEASAPSTTGGETPSGGTAATPDTTLAMTETSTGQAAGKPVTVTGLADVPTTTERVGTAALPKSAPAWKKEVSVCSTRSFQLVYDRDLPAILVLRGDEVLAWAGLYRRDVSDGCRDVRGKGPPPSSNESPEGIYESVHLRCTAPGRIQIETHAIEMNGSVYGSLINVTVAGRPEWLVSAPVVEDVEGRRVYVNYDHCELT